MGKSITWTLLYYKSFLEDVEKMLSFLRKYEGWAIKSDLRSIVKNNKNRDSILKFMEDVHLIEVRSTGRTSRYNITREGIDYLQSENRSKYLHKLLYKNILHYSYFYNYILENELYKFSKLQIIEKMVLNS
ncbi:MAG: hypothetical protein H5T44_06360, partial [Thermoplasmatales archaeon]|nr:hypothetical protein [Thermoplasmatales archaeon]